MKSQLFEWEVKELRNLRKLIVVGDLHGDLKALHSVLKIVDLNKDGLIFLGDYADRGEDGIEVIESVDSLMKRYPKKVSSLKGNHEDFTESGQPTFFPCNLMGESVKKKGNWQSYFLNEFKPFVGRLYLATIIPGETLFVHGGVSSKIKSLNDLKRPTDEIERDILWSDPLEGYGEYPNRRGAGVEFGIDVTMRACGLLGVKRIVRSHEPDKALRGPYYSHDGRVITTSSTSVYGGNPFVLTVNPANPSDISHIFL